MLPFDFSTTKLTMYIRMHYAIYASIIKKQITSIKTFERIY